MAVTNLTLNLAGGMVSVQDGQGLLLVTAAGFAGQLSAQVGIDAAANLGFTGSFSLKINTTNQAVSEVFQMGAGTITLELPAGPFIRISGESIHLEVLGQSLSGDFMFEQITIGRGLDDIPGTGDDIKAVKIAATNVNISLGDGEVSILGVTDGQGLFLILDKNGSKGHCRSP